MYEDQFLLLMQAAAGKRVRLTLPTKHSGREIHNGGRGSESKIIFVR